MLAPDRRRITSLLATRRGTTPDDLLETPKTLEQMAEDARLAVLMFWLSRGLVKRDKLHLATGRKRELPNLGEAASIVPQHEPGLKDVLLAMPNVGEDADFERLPDQVETCSPNYAKARAAVKC